MGGRKRTPARSMEVEKRDAQKPELNASSRRKKKTHNPKTYVNENL